MSIDNKGDRQQLSRLGWSAYFQDEFAGPAQDGLRPARVIGVRKNSFRVSDGTDEWPATLSGRLKHDAGSMYPVTGDWVLLADTLISRVLSRRNVLSRGASGTHDRQTAQPQKEQVIAANLDSVFIVSGLDRDFNLRRIERYLTLVYNCGLNPVIVLTKVDLHQNPGTFAGEVETIALGVPVHLVSVADDTGLTALHPYLASGQTVAMLGSSGAGKSTLLNRLYGESVQLTGAVSEQVGKGRHTTTNRDLIMMPQGGMLIDNPGIREIAFWDDERGIEAAFPEIETLGRECRFSDCSHDREPGCRVLRAVDDGEISAERLDNYRKMKRELEYLSSRQNKSADRVEKERWKGVALKIREMKKGKP